MQALLILTRTLVTGTTGLLNRMFKTASTQSVLGYFKEKLVEP